MSHHSSDKPDSDYAGGGGASVMSSASVAAFTFECAQAISLSEMSKYFITFSTEMSGDVELRPDF